MKVIAFSHIRYPRPEFETAARTGNLINQVSSRWSDIIKAYDDCSNIGLVYLFVANAYVASIDNETDFTDVERLEINVKAAIQQYIQRNCSQPNKFQIIGFNELQPLLIAFREVANNSPTYSGKPLPINQLLLGAGIWGSTIRTSYYDSPKVIEAIIRIARRHEAQPILRFDEDVIVNEQSVQKLIDEYQFLWRNNEKYFLFSGSYFTHNLQTEPEKYWLNDYAVRTQFLATDVGRNPPSYYGNLNIDPTTIPFRLDVDLAESFISDIPRIGADTESQPISGAGFCISSMSILQLPPFANVARFIVWIDDSLKRSLHEAIGEIDPAQVKEVAGATFKQDRGNLTLSNVQWAAENYLPRLVYGCLMHSLIIDLNEVPPAGPFAISLAEYKRTRKIPNQQDRRNWADAAINRLNLIRQTWTRPPFNTEPAGEILYNFATTELAIINPAFNCIIDEIVRDPTQDIEALSRSCGYPSDRNAGAYVAEVIKDLGRYINLMEIWPFIIRTIDFETRRTNPGLEWLTRPIN